MENFIPLGAGNARTLWDVGTTLYTAAGTTIVYDFSFNLGVITPGVPPIFYKALFMADGSAVAVRMDTGAVTVMGVAGTFDVTPTLPHCAQWGSSGILIITSGGYYAWDPTGLWIPGAFAPPWLNGGTTSVALSTTGDTHTSTLLDNLGSVTGVVAGMTIKGTGSDIQANTLVVSFTSGPNTITMSKPAVGTHVGVSFDIGWVMPSGVVGTAIETYGNRVWITNGDEFSFSAPGNGADFSTAHGGGTTASSDSFLRVSYMSLKQSNGFLYLFGDSSINVISNVQTSGSPATTTMNNQNVDPQTGLGWRDALVPFGRALCFANPTGVYALFGGAAEKISDKIDKLFENADFDAVPPTMFVVSIYSVRCLALILNTLDPVEDVQRTLIALWNGKHWFIASQSLVSIFGTTVSSDSNIAGWANDGTRVYQLFATPSATLEKKIQSKLWAGRSNLIFKLVQDAYAEVQDLSSPAASVVLSGTMDSDIVAPQTFTLQSNLNWLNAAYNPLVFINASGLPLQFITSPEGPQGAGASQAGLRLGITFTSLSPDFTMIGCGMTYNESSFYGH